MTLEQSQFVIARAFETARQAVVTAQIYRMVAEVTAAPDQSVEDRLSEMLRLEAGGNEEPN